MGDMTYLDMTYLELTVGMCALRFGGGRICPACISGLVVDLWPWPSWTLAADSRWRHRCLADARGRN